MKYFSLYIFSFLFVFLCLGCDNSSSTRNTNKDSIINQRTSIDILFDECFSLVKHHLEIESDLSDPYFVMDLPSEVIIDDAIIEISIKVEGVNGSVIVNGITPEAYTIKDRVFTVKSHQKDKRIEDKEVTIFIKENIIRNSRGNGTEP